MYIPVEEDTFGGTPKLSIIGLNITPPPRPIAPDSKPPRKAENDSFMMADLVKMRSEGTRPKLNMRFRDYSYTATLTDIIVKHKQRSMKRAKIVQSAGVHL